MKLLHKKVVLSNCTGPLTIIPFSCCHVDDAGFHEALFTQCIEEIRTTPDCIAVGLGDYFTFLRTTARKHLRAYVADDNSWLELDAMVRKEAQGFVERWLTPIKTKLVGLAEGNHLYTFIDGTTSTQYMCQLLGVSYLDKPCFMRLQVCDSQGKTLKVFRVLMHHGDWSGGAARMGTDLNSLETKAAGFDVDIFLAAHTHRRAGIHIPTLTIPTTGELKLVERPRALIRTGCFMRGYMPGCVGRYVDQKLLPPSDLGYVKLAIRFTQEHDPARYQKQRASGAASARQASDRSRGNLGYKFEFTV